ncbi:MAG: ATP-binding protein [bacterium]|nr:ATP-binding protein [bacterium]
MSGQSKRISVAQKVSLALVPAFLLLIGLILSGVEFLNTIGPTLDSSEVAHTEFVTFSSLKTVSSAASVTVGTYALSGKTELEKRYDALTLELDTKLDEARTKITDGHAKVTLDEFIEEVRNLRGIELLIVTETKAGNRERAAELLETYYIPSQTKTLKILDDFSEKKGHIVGELTAQLFSDSKKAVRVATLVLIPLIILIAVILYVILAVFVLRPIRSLAEATEKIKNNDFTARAKVFYNDEIGSLASAFNAMTSTVLISEKALREQLVERTEQVKKIDSLLAQQKEAVTQLKAHDDELAKANEQLRKLDSLKSEFVTVAAHQLRTPLTSIKWAYEELLTEADGALSDQQKKITQDGFQSSVNAIRIINDLLDLARIEEGRSQYVIKHQSILPIALSVSQQFSKNASYKDIELKSKISPEELPDVGIDSEKIQMVLENVLDNAVKYTHSGGKIIFSVSKGASGIVITVADTGIGIPEAQRINLFTKFFRGSNAMLVHTDGSGLGLYVAKRIVEDHGGTLTLQTEEKKGTTVTITLPA